MVNYINELKILTFMSILCEARKRSIELVDMVNVRQTTIQRDGLFPLFLQDVFARTKDYTWRDSWNDKRQHPFEEANDSKRIIRVHSKTNLLHLLIRELNGETKGNKETLRLFQVEPYPEQVCNTIKYLADKSTACDLSQPININDLTPFGKGVDERYNFDKRSWSTTADIYMGFLLSHLKDPDLEKLIAQFTKEIRIQYFKYDCDDMGTSFQFGKTGLVGVLLAKLGKPEAAKRYLELIQDEYKEMTGTEPSLLFKDLDLGAYSSPSDMDKDGESGCLKVSSQIYLLDYLLGGENYKRFRDWVSESFCIDEPLPAIAHLEGPCEMERRSPSALNTAWYALFLNAIGETEEAYKRLKSVDEAEDPYMCKPLLRYKEQIGPQEILTLAFAYADFGHGASLFSKTSGV